MDLPSTEERNPRTRDLDQLGAVELVAAFQEEDRRAAEAAARAREAIARVVELAHRALESGGRIVFVGAGTSGRLGVLEAAECPPTFSTPPEKVIALMAGGGGAFTQAVEGAEDDRARGAADVRAASVTGRDLVVGVTASGRTPYVLAALEEARSRGAETALVCCSRPQASGHLLVLLDTGPEALSGSTRMKAGTATKMALNAITTGAMVLWGRVHGNLMVDVAPTNEKLRDRARRIISELVPGGDAAALLDRASGEVKTAVVMGRLGVGADEARARLRAAGGFLRKALS